VDRRQAGLIVEIATVIATDVKVDFSQKKKPACVPVFLFSMREPDAYFRLSITVNNSNDMCAGFTRLFSKKYLNFTYDETLS
jgi:hypothetical protein